MKVCGIFPLSVSPFSANRAVKHHGKSKFTCCELGSQFEPNDHNSVVHHLVRFILWRVLIWNSSLGEAYIVCIVSAVSSFLLLIMWIN